MDFKLAHKASSSQVAQTSFTAYSLALHQTRELNEEWQKLEEEASTLQQVASYLTLNLPDPLNNPVISGVLAEVTSRRAQMSQIVRAQNLCCSLSY